MPLECASLALFPYLVTITYFCLDFLLDCNTIPFQRFKL